MQAPTLDTPAKIAQFRVTLSEPRFGRYLAVSRGNEQAAVNMYHWNSELSKALYPSLKMWEIALRNKLNAFLCWKYNNNWPFDQTRALRQLKPSEQRKVSEAITRLQTKLQITGVPLSAIVADLSAGFWVALLGTSYDVPFSWRYNLARIYPGEKTFARAEAAAICGDLLDLRNRVAHHEPIYHLPLLQRREELKRVLTAICPIASAYVEASCTFAATYSAHP
jgi:Abi-like protein